MKEHSTENIVGYPVTTKSKEDCISEIVQWIENGEKRRYFVCANPHSLVVARSAPFFNEAIKNADLIIPDGIGIVIASKILGGNIRSRVTGSDIFLGVSKVLNERNNYSCFFLGSTKNTLSQIKDRMKVDFPNIKLVGTYTPPFKPEFSDEENRLMVDAINNVKPDVLWVGMTAPKQEKWIYKHKDKLDVKFIGAIGAVFDFYSGAKKRAHPWFQKHALEWLPRFLREPKRLWRRNLISTPLFLFLIFKEKFRMKNEKST